MCIYKQTHTNKQMCLWAAATDREPHACIPVLAFVSKHTVIFSTQIFM